MISRDIAFWKEKAELEDIKNEEFGKNINDNWYDYIVKEEKIISFPGIISENEFKYDPINIRKNDITVPGVQYYYRRLAESEINKKKYKYLSQHIKRRLLSKILSKINSRFFLSYYNQSFNKSIEDTKVAYTCGSALGYPIRKFIEIPAKGTLLFAKPFIGYKEFGYQNDQNFVACDPNQINDKLEFYLNEIQKSQEIIRRCQKFLIKKHRFSAEKNN